MSTPILIDTDPGHDDACALLLAARAPELELLAVTVVAGNQTLAKTALNARHILTMAGRLDVPVAAGMAAPLVRPLTVAAHVHGESGLDGYDFGPPAVELQPEHGVDLMLRTIRTAAEPLTLVPLGPLTNVALALRREPSIVGNLARIVLMGGAAGLGNVTPSAEFNVYTDPEAAQIVFNSGVPITMVGLDATLRAPLRRAEHERIRGLGNEVGRMVAALMDWSARRRRRGLGGGELPIHDALAVAAVIRPDLLETTHVNVVVETAGTYTAGRTVCDLRGATDRPPNADVAVDADRDAFAELFITGLARY